MTHLTDAQAQLLADGALPPAEAPELERHVAGCVECRVTVETYRMLATALDGLDVPAPPADFTEGVLARIDVRERALQREKRHAAAIFVGVAIAAAVAFAAAGASAWAPVVSSGADLLGDAVQVFRIGAGWVPKVVSALRFQIIVAAAVLALPFLLALARLMPSARPETA